MQAEGREEENQSIRSMTGFGRGRAANGQMEVVAEVRSVNHRFLDVSVKLPRLYSVFEPRIRRLVSDWAQRGKLDVNISRSGGSGQVMDVTLDYDLAGKYHERLSELKRRLGLANEITVSDMLTLKEIVLPVEKEEGIVKELPLVESSLREALVALDGMRRAEGASVWRDIEARLISIREMGTQILPMAGQVSLAAKERLEKRVRELTGGIELDPDRLLQEVALIADRSDVTEEVTRLASHVEQFLAFGRQGSPLGRKLDFLLQELHREVNTIGSKSTSTDIAAFVVVMKTEVEKIREQTQNLE